MTKKKSKKKKKNKLELPDLKICQTLKPNGNTFMSLGGIPGHERCTEKAVYVAVMNKTDDDGLYGSMSLCAACVKKMQAQLGDDYATLVSVEEYSDA